MEKEQLTKLKTPDKKRVELTISEKLKVLEYAELHSERETAAKFGISKTAVNTMKKQRSELEMIYKANKEATEKRCRRVRYTKTSSISDKVWRWVKLRKAYNQPITDKIIQQKACLLALRNGIQNFSASNGWLESFKQLNGISIKKSSVNVQKINTLAQTLKSRKKKEKREEETEELLRDSAEDDIPSHAKGKPPFEVKNEVYNSLVLDERKSRYLKELKI